MRGRLERAPAVAAAAALCEAVCALVIGGAALNAQPHTVGDVLLVVAPTTVLAALTIGVAGRGLRRGAVGTGQLLLLQLLWIGWSQVVAMGAESGAAVNVFGALGLVAVITVVVAGVIDLGRRHPSR